MSRPLLLGHRGARAVKSIPENTLLSFDLALAHGCDGFEFDVRLTGDSQAVICHDPETRRAEVARSRAQQLIGLPRLQEVLIRYQRNAFLDIELKVSGLEKIIARELPKRMPSRGVVISSFLPAVLNAVHAENLAIPLGLICETKAQLNRWGDLPVEYVMLNHALAFPDRIGEIQGQGKRVFVWTVNRAAEMRRFADWGVDGIIYDETERLVRVLRGARIKTRTTTKK